MVHARRALLVSLAVGVAVAPCAGAAATLRGTVFVDKDGDGLLSAGDEPVPNVVVGFENDSFATTDAQGQYQTTIARDGIVWIRTPEGFSPTPSWKTVSAATPDVTADLILTPSTATGPLRFVVTADVHVGFVSVERAKATLAQTSALSPEPYFVTVVGDLADRTDTVDDDMLSYMQAAAAVPFPIVPVPGNHDWQDGGFRYRRLFGPPLYSFDSGGVHFLVLNMADARGSVVFAQRDLATVPKEQTTVALVHWLGDDADAEALAAAGVDFVFSGHSHANRAFERVPGLVEVNTEAMAFGGLFYTPAGYRVVEKVGAGFVYQHHTTVDHPVVQLMAPRDATCLPANRSFEIIAAVETSAQRPVVTASLDDREPIALAHTGGWTYSAESEAIEAGNHIVTIEVAGPGLAGSQAVHSRFCVADLPVAATPPDWPQLQGGAARLGVAAARLSPPLRESWTRTVGGHLVGGSPVMADGTLVVPVVDLDYSTAGGVIAFDARTGELAWEDRVGSSVHNAPAIADGTVVFVSEDGILHADELATGRSLWTVDTLAGRSRTYEWQYSAPAIARGMVLVRVDGQVLAYDLGNGAPQWTASGMNTTAHVSMAAPAVLGDVGVAVVGQDQVFAWDVNTGMPLWNIADDTSLRLEASPTLADGLAFLAGADGMVAAIDLPSGQRVWSRRVYTQGGLGYGLVATPSFADGRLIVPGSTGPLFALDVATGAELWHIDGEAGVVRPFMYRSDSAGFYGSAVVTGDLVWAGGVDGVIRAVDAATGAEVYDLDLGSPVLSGLVPGGDSLYVATYDGTVHALATVVPDAGPTPEAQGGGGCAVGGAPGGLAAWAVALALAQARRRRRSATRPRSASGPNAPGPPTEQPEP